MNILYAFIFAIAGYMIIYAIQTFRNEKTQLQNDKAARQSGMPSETAPTTQAPPLETVDPAQDADISLA